MNDFDVLPTASKPLERALAQMCRRLEPIPVPLLLAWDIDNAPSDFLPFLAYAYSVDNWSEAWDDSTKRAVIKASLATHGKKGTLWAVRTALHGIGAKAEITEWFNKTPQGQAGTFHIELDSNTAHDLGQIVALVGSVKRFSAHYELSITTKTAATLCVYGASVVGIELTIST